MGSTNLRYKVDYTEVDPRFKAATVTLDASKQISGGIVCYSFNYNALEFTIVFPQSVPQGKSEFGPIYLRKEAELKIHIVEAHGVGISISKLQSQNSLFRRKK